MSDSENEQNEKPYPKDSQVQGEYEEQNNNQNEENDMNNGEDNNFPEEENNQNEKKQSNNNSDIENNDINNNNVNNEQKKQNEENFNDNTFPEKDENNNDDFAEPENQENNNNNKEEKLDENDENNNNKTNSFRFSNEQDARLSSNGPLNLKNVKDNEFEYEEENKNENNENMNNNNANNNNSFGFRDSDLNNNNNENNNQYDNDFNNNKNENENNFNKLRDSEKSDGYMNNNDNNNESPNNKFNSNISNPYNNNNSQIKKSNNNNNFNYVKNPYVDDNNNNNNFNNSKNNNFNNNKNNNFNNNKNNNFNKNNNNNFNYNNNNNNNNNKPVGGYGNNQTYMNNQTQSAFIPQDSPITNKLNTNNNYNYSSNYQPPNYSSHSQDYDPLFERYEQNPEDNDGFSIDPSKSGRDSSTTAGIQIANTIMGAGILSIPLMMSYLGILLGAILLLFLAVLTIYSVYILMRCHQITGKSGYSMFGKITMGTIGSVLVKIVIIVNNMGLCICYLRIFGEVFQTIIQSFVSKDGFFATNWHNFFFILIGAIILFFFIFIKNISSLKKVSYLGVIAALIFAVLLAVLLLYKTIANELDSDVSWRFLFPDCTFPEAFQAAPTVFLAFLFQFNVFPIYYSLQHRGSRAMFRATKIGVFFSLIIFLIIGIVGFLLYGFYDNYDDENYYEVYGTTNNDTATYDTILDKLNDDMILYKGYNVFVVIVIIIICASFIVTCISSFPILFLSLRANYINSLEVCKRARDNSDITSVQIFQGQHEKRRYTIINKKMLILVTIVLYLFMVAMAILIYNLKTMFHIIGTIAGTFIAFIFPNIFYIRIIKMSGKNYSLILPFIIMILGIFFFVMALIMAFF